MPRVPIPLRSDLRWVMLFDMAFYQLASKFCAWSFVLRVSVPACVLPVLFLGIVVQNTLARYDSRFGSGSEYSPLVTTAKNFWPVTVLVNSMLAG